jgi:cytosine/adenosine deaminase-related metal-dependent hydrolase
MQQRVFFRGPMLITLDPLGVEAADILVADGCIARKGWRLQPPRDAEVVDARGRLLCPGLVNAHVRLDASFLHLMPPHDGDGDALAKLRAACTEESLIAESFATAIEAVRSGTTSLFAFHDAVGFVRGSLARIRDVMATIGIRSSAAYGVSARLSPEASAVALAESRDAAMAGSGSRTAFLLGADDLATAPEATLAALAESGKRYETPVHAVLGAGADLAGIERLRKAGLLRPHSVLVVHGALPPAEAARLAEARVTVVRSSAAAGAALGTDSSRPDLFEHARLAFARARAAGDPVSPENVVQMLGRAQQAASGLFKASLGSFEPGSAADLVLLDYRAATPLNAATLAHHVLFGMSAANVQSVMVDGHFVLKDRAIVNVDVRNLFRQTQRGALDLWQRAFGADFPGLDAPVRAQTASDRQETREPARFDEQDLEFEPLVHPADTSKPWLVCRPGAEAETQPVSSVPPAAPSIPAAATRRGDPPAPGAKKSGGGGFGAGIV